MISASDRENAVLLINEAIASGASCKKACWTVWIVNFNTSHVTVYLPQTSTCLFGGIISIHLMLRFIRRRTEGFIAKVVISIHLMLRFIAPDLMHP